MPGQSNAAKVNVNHVAGHVYLMEGGGFYKVGRSADPRDRLRNLSVPFELKLAYAIASADCVWLESYMHAAFAPSRVRGEWFRLTADDVEAVAAVNRIDGPTDVPAALALLHARSTARARPELVRVNVAATLRELARTRGISMREVSERSGLHYSRVHSIMTGGTPNPGILTVRAVLTALDSDLGLLD